MFNEEEYHCYMVQCLDYGNSLTARETGEEMSNELAEMKMKIFREILEVQPQNQEESQGVQENHRSYFTTNLKHNKPSAAVSITLPWMEYKSTT